jgi:isochorismate synthase EntC
MMTNVPAPPAVAPAAWQHRIVPAAGQIRALLECGAVFAWSADRWLIGWGPARRAAQPDPQQPSFYAPDYLLTDPAPWRIYPQIAAVSPDGLARELTGASGLRHWEPFDEGAFAGAFTHANDAFAGGELQKAVAAVFERSAGPFDEAERARSLRALANLPSGLMPYGCWDDEGGLLGAAPELLFEYDGVEIHTMAVAGTARAGTAPEEMMEDPKERAEHRYVLEDLEAQLAPLGPVTHGATRPWRIGILSHLRTDLRVTPDGPVRFDELVHRLHPTPAVGTAPRQAWRTWAGRLDSQPRGRFAAPFGLILPGGAARCMVAIRHLAWDRETTWCGAGCGLVPGSRLERETAELRLKLAATRGNLGL